MSPLPGLGISKKAAQTYKHLVPTEPRDGQQGRETTALRLAVLMGLNRTQRPGYLNRSPRRNYTPPLTFHLDA